MPNRAMNQSDLSQLARHACASAMLVLLIGCAATPQTAQPDAPTAPARVASNTGDRVYGNLRPTPVPAVNDAGWVWDLPPGVPAPAVPADNPMTAAKVELGRYLFYDIRLSGNGTQSCATCHAQALAFTDGRRTSTGSTGDAHPRNAQALVNVAYNSTLTWANPVLSEIEKQVQIPMFGEFPVELGITGKDQLVLGRIKDDARYRGQFAAAFPGEQDPMTFGNIVKALASFSRALISFDSPYDRFTYRGDKTALSESAQRGMALFLSEAIGMPSLPHRV